MHALSARRKEHAGGLSRPLQIVTLCKSASEVPQSKNRQAKRRMPCSQLACVAACWRGFAKTIDMAGAATSHDVEMAAIMRRTYGRSVHLELQCATSRGMQMNLVRTAG